MDAKLRVAVAGSGIGRNHIEAFKNLPELYEVVAIAGKDERTRKVAEQYGVARISDDFSELCRMPDVDVIDICTPTFLHYEQTLQALRAGKHIILEKPSCGSLRELDGLVAAEKSSGRRIMPIFQNRLGTSAQKMRFLVKEGVTGRAYLATAETAWRRRWDYYNGTWHGKWSSELGGALVTLGIHAHDVLTSIIGPARSVFARMNTRVNPVETEDCFSASLEMADGSLASLSLTTGSCDQITRLRFTFANLSAESPSQTYGGTSAPWKITPDSPEAAVAIEAALARFTPLPEGFAGHFSGFYTGLRDNTPFPVTLDDSRQAIELLTAFFLSSRSNRPVELPILPDHPYYDGWLPDSK
jgi:predicted dehydrogenase